MNYSTLFDSLLLTMQTNVFLCLSPKPARLTSNLNGVGSTQQTQIYVVAQRDQGPLSAF